MKFRLEVGEQERHLIESAFTQLRGQLCLRMNRGEVCNQVRLPDEPPTETRTLVLGRTERLVVRLERERQFLFGRRCRVYFNDRVYRHPNGD
jgi:hypothetical protein